MICKVCGSNKVRIIYNDKIRNGGLGQYTKQNVQIYQCEDCDVIWHDNVLKNTKEYYESTKYRDSLEGGAEEARFYELHDRETLAKLTYTGTDIFRNKIVADIGCGCGAFLDFVKGVSRNVIAIEPSCTYRKIMERKGFYTYAYAGDALSDYRGQIDVITSFDVIEHVEDPEMFLKEVFDLLANGGQAIVGTPTDAPVMRAFLGEIYEKKVLFSTQHLWIFAEENLRLLAQKVGFKQVEVKYYQRYGIDNLLGWLKEKSPNSDVDLQMISETINSVWKSHCAEAGTSDYIVLYLKR